MTYGTTVNFEGLKSVLYKKYPTNKGIFYNIFQSAGKRIEYCNIYYSYFQDSTTEEKIKLDYDIFFLPVGTEYIDYRVIYESATLSFLQNIHALSDSLSFSINEIALTTKKIDDKLGFNKKLLQAIKAQHPDDDRLHDAVNDLISDKDFQKLRGYVNSAKHSHIIPIINFERNLMLEGFTYWDGQENVETPQEELSLFMLRVHEVVVGKVISIYIAMLEMIKE